ncbi:hypothetical protein TWF696_007786 [Orbilia brochopaga]|uniref:Uncharacterized protein n=1 Tax=Orbilia brochopaga TaxID=3140254 RepID=A0AAV9UPX3_9PEZI
MASTCGYGGTGWTAALQPTNHAGARVQGGPVCQIQFPLRCDSQWATWLKRRQLQHANPELCAPRDTCRGGRTSATSASNRELAVDIARRTELFLPLNVTDA